MHIADGALSTEVMVVSNLLAAGGVGVGLRTLDFERVPRVGILASVFFVASYIHISIGPSSVHLLLNGLLGLLLGWAAVPALAAALILQGMLLGYGGVTSWGANLLILAVPAVLCHYLCRRSCYGATSSAAAFAWGAVGGSGAVLGSCLLMAFLLHVSDAQSYDGVARAVVVLHLPLAAIEAAVLGAAVTFIRKVRPELLRPPVRGGRPDTAGGVGKVLAAATSALLLLAPSTARAHKIKCFASADGAAITGYAWAGSTRLADIAVTVSGPDGRVLAEGRTDVNGEFSVSIKHRCEHTVVIRTDDGHQARFSVAAEDFPDGLPTLDQAGGGEPGPRACPGVDGVEAPGGEAPVGLQQAIGEAVRKEVAPLRRQLNELAERRTLQDVLGGIGYLLGLTGLAFYFLGVRKRHEPAGD